MEVTMGLWNWITGASTSANKVVDTACNVVDNAVAGVDKMFYTDEEKAKAKKEMIAQYLEYVQSTLKETSIRSVTRRVVALGVIGVWLFLILVSVAGFFLQETSMVQFILALLDRMTFPVSSVIVFYFGPYMLSYLTKGFSSIQVNKK
jgi:hypothetical protein